MQQQPNGRKPHKQPKGVQSNADILRNMIRQLELSNNPLGIMYLRERIHAVAKSSLTAKREDFERVFKDMVDFDQYIDAMQEIKELCFFTEE